MNEKKPMIEHDYSSKSKLPPEMIYADDGDFITDDPKEKEELNNIVTETLMKENLKVNDSKTEHTIIKRGNRKEE